MIGADNSPLSGFNGGGSAFQAALAQGTGPASSIADALRGTVDTYHKVLSAAQENAYRTQQIKTKYDQLGSNRLDYESARASDAAAAKAGTPSQFQNYDYSKPIMTTVDGKQVAIYPKYGPTGGFLGVQTINPNLNVIEAAANQPQTTTSAAQSKLDQLAKDTHDLITAQNGGNIGQGGSPLP